MTDNKLYITWDDVEKIVDSLAIQIEQNRFQQANVGGHAIHGKKPLSKSIGVSRGGLIPGVMLSHKLDVPFEPLEWQTRDGHYIKDTLKLLSNKFEDQSDILFVDDICDSGLTIKQIRSVIPDSQWCVLYSKLGDMALDFEGEKLYNNTQWLVFPWEKD